MPTEEEIAKFKKAFKKDAKTVNKGIRWEEPSGTFSFFQTQTSLAGVLKLLEQLQADPTLENVQMVEDAIEKIPKDKYEKYKDAIDTLVLSLKNAVKEDLERLVVDDSSSVVDEDENVDKDVKVDEDSEDGDVEEWIPPEFDPSILPAKSVTTAFLEQFGNPTGWKAKEQAKSLFPVEDKQTKMIFNKDPLDIQTQELKYLNGNVPTTRNDTSSVGQSLDDFSQNDKAMVGVGLSVVEDIRSKLTKGPFNNYLGLPEDVTDQHLIPDVLLKRKLEAECGEMSLEELQDHTKQLFRVDNLTIESVTKDIAKRNKRIEKLDERINELKLDLEQLEEDTEDYDNCIEELNETQEELEGITGDRNSLGIKLQKLERIDGLTELEDLEEWIKETPAPGWWNAVVDTAAGLAAKLAREKYKDIEDKRIQMACLGRATLEVGGGVCSKMAMATHGELMTKLPPGSEIAQVFHTFDHEFVAARAPGGRWFVVDPWPHNPAVVPFVDSYFDPKDVANFVITVVKETCDYPYGVDLSTGFNWKAIIEQAKEETSLGSVEMKGTYGHSSGCDKNVDPRLKGASNWG